MLLSFMETRKIKHSAKVQKEIEKRIRKQLDWDSQPDSQWQFYLDLLNLAKNNGLNAYGLDLNESLKRRITRKGLTGITPVELQQVHLTGFNDPEYESWMKNIFTQVHCGMGHDRMLNRLYDTWVARNDKMALSIKQISDSLDKNPLVVIVGGGHTEYGLGVMNRVEAIDPKISQVNVSLQEIAVSASPMADYTASLKLDGYPQRAPADFIWFSQRVSYEDPCQQFKSTIEKMKARSKK